MPTGWKYTRGGGTDHKTGTFSYRKHIGKEMVHPPPEDGVCLADWIGKPCGPGGYHLGKTLRGAGQYSRPDAIFRCSYSRKDVLGEDEHKVRVTRLKVISEEPTWKGYGPRGRQVLEFIGELGGLAWFVNVGQPYDKPPWAESVKTVDSWAAAGAAAGAAARDAAWAAAGAAAWAAAWDAARDAAGAAARDAARDAAWAAAGNAAGNAAGAAARDAARDAAWAAARDAAWAAAGNAYEIIAGIKDGYFSRLMEVYRAGHWPVSYDGKTLVIF